MKTPLPPTSPEKESKKPNCLKCRLLRIADYGYSDWTVEGTMISCMKERFDNREQAYESDKEKAEDERGVLEKAADGCPFFVEGDPLEMNVDYDGDKDAEVAKRCVESDSIRSLDVRRG